MTFPPQDRMRICAWGAAALLIVTSPCRADSPPPTSCNGPTLTDAVKGAFDRVFTSIGNYFRTDRLFHTAAKQSASTLMRETRQVVKDNASSAGLKLFDQAAPAIRSQLEKRLEAMGRGTLGSNFFDEAKNAILKAPQPDGVLDGPEFQPPDFHQLKIDSVTPLSKFSALSPAEALSLLGQLPRDPGAVAERLLDQVDSLGVSAKANLGNGWRLDASAYLPDPFSRDRPRFAGSAGLTYDFNGRLSGSFGGSFDRDGKVTFRLSLTCKFPFSRASLAAGGPSQCCQAGGAAPPSVPMLSREGIAAFVAALALYGARALRRRAGNKGGRHELG